MKYKIVNICIGLILLFSYANLVIGAVKSPEQPAKVIRVTYYPCGHQQSSWVVNKDPILSESGTVCFYLKDSPIKTCLSGQYTIEYLQ